MLELRPLRYFVAVAQAGHVGRAAEQLAISQPPLSRQIKALEDRLGLALFDRSQRRLRLTEAGTAFLRDAQRLLAHAAEVEQGALQAARGTAGRLTLGSVEAALRAGWVQADLLQFTAAAPAVRVGLRGLRSGAIIEALRRGELDAGYCHQPPPADDGQLASRLRGEEPFVLALPRGHALARGRAPQPAALDGQTFVAMPAATHAAARAQWLAGCQAAGFTPDVRFEAGELGSVLSLVAAGLGLALVGRSSRDGAPPGVVFRALPALTMRLQVHLVWRRQPLSAAARHFVEPGNPAR